MLTIVIIDLLKALLVLQIVSKHILTVKKCNYVAGVCKQNSEHVLACKLLWSYHSSSFGIECNIINSIGQSLEKLMKRWLTSWQIRC